MVARAIPGLGLGLNALPYTYPPAMLNAPDASQPTSPDLAATGGGDFSNGLGSWLGALGMALLSSPRNAPFASLPQIMPAIMQQAQQRAALQQQMKVLETGRNQLNGGGVPSLADILGGDSAPGAPPVPNIGGGQTPQYPDTGMPNMSAGGALGKISDPRNKIPVIQQAALRYGIDPVTAVKVAASEGLKNPVGDNGMSHGAFQLYLGGGEGNNFARDTGLDPTDPNNEDATIDYAMRRASQVGWAPWHGAKRIGLDRWAGIGQASAAVPSVQMAQAGPQAPLGSNTSASLGLVPPSGTGKPFTFQDFQAAGIVPPNAQYTGGSPGTNQASAAPATQYTPAEIAKYRSMGIPLSPQSAQQAIQNKTDQMATAPGSVSPSYARGQDSLAGEVARTTPQVLPDGTSQRPAATAPSQGPTPTQYQQAQVAAQRPPPPSPDQVSGDLGNQRAAAIRYYEYYGDLAMKFAPFGEAGKAVADAAKQRMEIAKEVLTEGQKKRLEAQYAFPIAQSTASGTHAGALPYMPLEERIKANEALRQNLAQQGQIVDPNNLAGGTAAIPNFGAINAANESAKAGAVAGAQLGPTLAQKQAEADLALRNEKAKLQAAVDPNFMGGPGSNQPGSGQAAGGQAAGGQQAPTYGPGATEPMQTDRGTVIPPIVNAAPITGSYEQLKDMQSGKGGWNDTEKAWNQAVHTTPDDEATIKTIAKAFQGFETGSFKSSLADLRAKARTFGIDLPISDDPAQAQLAAKLAFQKMVGSMRGIDSNPTGWELKAKVDNWVSTDSQPETNREMMAQSLAAIRQTNALARDWAQAKQLGWRNPQDFEMKWQEMPQNSRDAFLARAREEIGVFKGMQGAASAPAGQQPAPPPPSAYQPIAPGQAVSIPSAGQTQAAQPSAPAAPRYQEGSFAMNPKTGEVRIMRNGQWVPFR